MQYAAYYDDSKRPMDAKISEAMSAYLQRFGRAPTVAVVAPMHADTKIDGVVVQTQPYVRDNYVLLGEA